MEHQHVKKAVLTKGAPEPIGPYSQAIEFGHLVFCSGQIPLDPNTGQVPVTDIEGQTHRALDNLKAVLEAAGSSLGQVLKTTIFLKSMSDFPKVNQIYASYFKEVPPARSTIEVSRLPRDVLVEIEAIAVKK